MSYPVIGVVNSGKFFVFEKPNKMVLVKKNLFFFDTEEYISIKDTKPHHWGCSEHRGELVEWFIHYTCKNIDFLKDYSYTHCGNTYTGYSRLHIIKEFNDNQNIQMLINEKHKKSIENVKKIDEQSKMKKQLNEQKIMIDEMKKQLNDQSKMIDCLIRFTSTGKLYP